MSAAYCWGIFREEAHSPGRETDDAEILRLTGKHLEARGFRVLLQSPEEISALPSERPGGAKNYRYEVPADTYLPAVQRAP